MIFHNFDTDPSDPIALTWTEVYEDDDALIAHINNPPVQTYVEKHNELCDGLEVGIYGNLADETINRHFYFEDTLHHHLFSSLPSLLSDSHFKMPN